MNRSFGVAMIVLLVAALAAGCAKNRSPAAQSDQVTIVVDNQNFYDATVYLRWYGDRRRLGDVGGFSRKEFQTRWAGSELQVEVRLLAGRTYRGHRMPVSPGETIEVELPPNLDRIRSSVISH